MPARTRTTPGTSWRRMLTSSIAGFPKFLSPLELTKSSWAVHIKSRAEVPDAYKSFFEPFRADESTFPYTVLTPSYENFIHKTTEKIICVLDHDIYILERKGDSVETQCYPVDEVSYVEMRTALLASSFKICGRTKQGDYVSSTLKFNSITDYLFTPILKRVRPVPVEPKSVVQSTEAEKFNCLADVNYKFMNLARHSLLEGERVIQFVLQPEIQEERLTFLKKTFYRTLSATHMSILTDRELIVIREEATQRREDRYGGIWDYIPLGKIESLSISERTDTLLALTIQLPEEDYLELLFEVPARAEIQGVVDRYSALAIAAPQRATVR